MAFINVAPGLVNSWDKKLYKALRLKSCWDEFSNLANNLVNVTNNIGKGKVPKEMLHYIDAAGNKSFETTVPMVEGLKLDGVGGMQQAENKGEVVGALYATVHWNLNRKVMRIPTIGVEASVTEYLKIAETAHTKLSDWMAEDKDYRCQQALLEGGDRYITDSTFWDGYEDKKQAPHTKRLHPNIAWKGMKAGQFTRGADFAADKTNLKTALGTNLAPESKFDLNALNGSIDYAYRFIAPLNMSAGNNAVVYVMLLSPYQALQLARDSDWKSLMTNAEKRGPENRAISGILGIHRGVLLIEDQRSPIFNLSTGEFEYVTPMEAAKVDSFYGHGKLNRAEKGAGTSATGSVEIARIMGAGALGCPMKGKVEFDEDSRDFGKVKEICASVECGYNRLDFFGKDVYNNNAIVVKNVSSALYFTSTPSITY